MGSQVDKRKVVVKNVSLQCSKFTLANFLEPVFDNDVEEIEYFENINETVLVHFANDIEEFDKCRRTDRAKKPLEGSCVKLIQVFQPDGVLVQDLLPEITEDILTFYFENKKSGGRCNAVEHCKIYRSIQMAVVKFVNCEVACSVLKVKWHVPSNDHKVRLKPYIEPFHLDSLEKLSQKAEKENEKQIQQPVHLPNKSPSPQPALSRNKPASTENASQETSVESNDLRTLEELVQTFKPEDNSCWQTYIKSDCEDISDELCRTSEDSPRQKPRLNTAINFTDEDFVSFTERNIVNSPLEGEKSNVHVKGKLQMQDTNENALKKKEMEDEMERKERERQLADEKARNETQAETKIEKEVLQYKPLEVKLIRKRLSDEKFPHLVDFNDYTGNIVIEGSHSQLMETKVLIMSIKIEIENNNFTLPTMVSSVMKREAGKKCIKDCVIKFKSVEYSVVDSTFTCAALSRNDVDEVVEDLKHLIKQEHLTYGPEHNKYLASPAWAEKKDLLEKQFNLMMIACEPGSKKIKIEGLNGDVYKAKNEVQQELVKNSHKSETFKVTGAKARCLQKSFQREIADLKDVISKCSGVFKDVIERDMYEFNFSGEVGKVEQVSMELDKMVKTIWHETVVLVRDVVKDKDLELLITGLQKSNLKKFQIVFEMEHSCFLTFTLPKLPTSGSTNTSYREFSDEGGFEESPIVRIGSTSIQTRQGDITKHRASVLVNVVSPDLDLKHTDVSQAFMRNGGATLLMAFQKETTANPRKRIFVTFGYDLNCDYVYHVVLNKHSSPSSRQEFINTIEDCFSLARKYNTKSIAFPAVGCGVIFNYNSSFVASSLISVAKYAASQSSHLKDVTFVIDDQDDYIYFLQELSSSSSMATTGQSEVLRTFSEAFHTSRKPSLQTKTAQITVVAKTKADCVTAKKALIKELQTSFLHTEMITNDGITNLPRKAAMELITLAKTNGIFIKFSDPKKQKHAGLKLKGEQNTVTAIRLKVQDILLLTEKSKVKKERTVQLAKPSAPGFIKHMAATSDHHTPGYWTYFKKGKSLIDLQSDIFGLKKKTDWSLENVPSGTDIFYAINDLVIKTWKNSLVGQGNDAAGLSPHTIKVVKIERLENLKLFKGYCQNRAKVFLKAAHNPIKAIKSLPGSNGEVLTTSMAAKVLRQEIYVTEINEHYVFHGTKQDKIKIICQNGLDSRVGSSSRMFGSGIYAAESSTKADQYADDKTARTANGTPLCMILTRMVLGEPFMTNNKNSPKFTMPPCKKCHTACCPKHPDTFDSVIGDGSWLFREFVVYERDLTYPEYFITYHRQ